MAPMRSKKARHSTEKPDGHSQRTVAIRSPERTPTQNPRKRSVGITAKQKQALIDNLQLEVTERARKLRAQYALQAQSLRTRIEMRINRIPTSLRNANMGDLFAKSIESTRQAESSSKSPQNASISSKEAKEATSVEAKVSASERFVSSRGVKRKSDDMSDANKENGSDSVRTLPNPKKRTKANAAAAHQPPKTSTVLSPKSANSRTLPQSPLKPDLESPHKSFISRPTSPLKPFSAAKQASPAKAAAIYATATLATMLEEKGQTANSRPGQGRKVTNPRATSKTSTAKTKRGPDTVSSVEQIRAASSASTNSATSTGTTLVKKGGRPVATNKKKDQPIGRQTAAKKSTSATTVPPPAAGRRVLRKRA